MKNTFSIFIVNPENGEFVTIEDWRKAENPAVAEFVAIVRHDGSGILVAKSPVSVDGKINFKWEKAVELAAEFTSNGKVNASEGFRLPNRREAHDIFDARFQGLDKALELIGGTPIYFGWLGYMWTEDEHPDPVYNGDYAFVFHGGGGYVVGSSKYTMYTVRPVSHVLG